MRFDIQVFFSLENFPYFLKFQDSLSVHLIVLLSLIILARSISEDPSTEVLELF